MGIYSEYLDKGFSFQDLVAERKQQLQRISQFRGHDVLVYACDAMKGGQAPIALDYSDLLPITDQLQNLNGEHLDFILETVGGSGEVAEDIVRIVRNKYKTVSFIIPGMAKSAGTIIAMSGDEILMDHLSALGPIDAQIGWEGKQFSAEAFLKGFERIKEEADQTSSLNRAYIPILQRISPGELQHAENAMMFARVLVRQWLATYKFKEWNNHKNGEPVTQDEREQRADEAAKALCDHSTWLTHGRSLKLENLEAIGIKITDFSKTPELQDAIRRYFVLLQMTLSATNAYKIIETPGSQIHRFTVPPAGATPSGGNPNVAPVQVPEVAVAGITCSKCGREYKIQLDFDKLHPLQPGTIRYPSNDVLVCEGCQTQHNLAEIRNQIEMQTKRRVVRQ